MRQWRQKMFGWGSKGGPTQIGALSPQGKRGPLGTPSFGGRGHQPGGGPSSPVGAYTGSSVGGGTTTLKNTNEGPPKGG